MISEPIEAFLKELTASSVTDIFLIVLVVAFLLSMYFAKNEKYSKLIHNTPNILTSLGILGTFTGIVIGLLDFNVKDIDGSINLLLEGLKVAFITSLTGIAFSILLKIRLSANSDKVKDDIGIDDLYNILNTQNENILKLQKALNDNDESSLIGQIKLIRSDVTDNQKVSNKNLEVLIESTKNTNETLTNIDKSILNQQDIFSRFTDTLWIKLQDFADMLSKSATEQVIEALNSVIKEFNDKLTEQFGENFKELNKAVEKLVIWQDNYKEQLQDMKNQFEYSVGSMGIMEKSIESISNHSSSIPESMNNLEQVITTNQNQIEELNRHLEAFKDIRDRAVEAVPEIRNQIDTTIKGIEEASKELIGGVNSSTEKISSAMVQSADDFAENVKATNGALVQSSDTLTKSSEDIKEQLDATLLDINKHVREMIENLSNNSKDVSDNFKKMGETLSDELTKNNKQVTNQIKESNDSLNEASKKIQDSLSDLTKDLQKDFESLANEQVRQTNKIFDSLDNTIKQTTEKTGESISNQITIIDEQAGKEIENVMNAMGKALTTITNQFTKDYQKLVNEMKKITESHRY